MSFLEECQEHFGTTDLYEILGIRQTASESQGRCYHDINKVLALPSSVELFCNKQIKTGVKTLKGKGIYRIVILKLYKV